MRATISVWGLQSFDGHVLDDFHIPARLDRDTFIQNLLMETVELEVIYPNPGILRGAIDIWSARRLPIWEKLVDTTEYEYNPIWNYDRTETETTTNTGSSSGTSSVKNTGTISDDRDISETVRTTGTVTEDGATTGTSSGTTTETKEHLHDVAGFNSSTTLADTAADRDRDNNTSTVSGTSSGTNDNTTTYNVTDTKTGSDDNTRTLNTQTAASNGGETEDHGTRSLRAFGNIGVTTTQDMIEAERRVVDFSVMEVIIKEFIMQFCIAVY